MCQQPSFPIKGPHRAWFCIKIYWLLAAGAQQRFNWSSDANDKQPGQTLHPNFLDSQFERQSYLHIMKAWLPELNTQQL
jgi:hypothetical protein